MAFQVWDNLPLVFYFLARPPKEQDEWKAIVFQQQMIIRFQTVTSAAMVRLVIHTAIKLKSVLNID